MCKIDNDDGMHPQPIDVNDTKYIANSIAVVL